MLLLGTTDEEYEGDPADVAVTEKDIRQILDEAALSVRDQQLSRDLITYSFAGLRVLPGGPGDTAKAKRETVVTEGRGGMLSVAGGKWTTFRHIGRTVHEQAGDAAGPPAGRGHRADLRAAEEDAAARRRQPARGRAPAAGRRRRRPARGWRADTAKHLATHYGSLAFDIARLANENPELRRARSTRTRRRSGRRSSTPATTSGPRRRTTCCAAVRR